MNKVNMKDSEYIEILEKNILNKNTLDNYKLRLKSLKNILNLDNDKNGFHKIMTNYDKYQVELSQKIENPSTQKNIITSILTLFKYGKRQDKFKISYNKWLKYHKSIKNIKQNKNIVNRSELKNIYNNLKKNGELHDTLKSSMRTLLLLFSIYQNAKGFLGNLEIIKEPNDKIKNFIILETKTIYKNNKIENLHPKIYKHLKLSLSKYPRNFVFIAKDNKPYDSNNSFILYVHRTFKNLFGKNIGFNNIT